MNKSKRKTVKVADRIADSVPKSPVVQSFQTFALELEEKQDRHERLVKISRDVTVESKRLIFFLHTYKRGTTDGEKVLCDAKDRLINIVQHQFSKILKELDERDLHLFLKGFSFGVQEFIEAFSLYHYLSTETLLTYDEVQNFLLTHIQMRSNTPPHDVDVQKEENKMPISDLPAEYRKTDWTTQGHHSFVTIVDYILGLNDLTGELMRYCINQVAYGEIQVAFDVTRFITNLYTGMLSVSFHSREYNRKLTTVMQSVRKVELACYTLRVRGSEMPKRMIYSVLDDEKICEDDSHF